MPSRIRTDEIVNKIIRYIQEGSEAAQSAYLSLADAIKRRQATLHDIF